MNQRSLEAHEIRTIIPIAKAYIEASRLPIVFNGEKVVSLWQVLYAQEKGELRGLFNGVSLVGLFGIHKMDSSFGEIRGANEWIWWVEPDCRCGSEGMALLFWAEEWAKTRGLGLQVGAYDCLHGALLARLYTRRGYERRGAIFTKLWQE